MVIQMALGSKGEVAPFKPTVVRFLSRMYPHVSLEVSLLMKGFFASLDRTHKLLQPSVLFQVSVQFELLSEGLPAAFICTFEGLVLDMGVHMVVQMASGHETFSAAREFAGKGSGASMDFLVRDKLLDTIKTFSAL
jgi:hypothetical protein